ncbi:Retrovirus-related Pol polyprotein from transposon TNT 1-94 [Dendrobium catenatum]|uniref:Retrovirus-related Pol polyprotein from transposon TNT 1-94 n=1 Tax=Dendrobium catenatum TaxID=906689 RepID=A0A2I0XCW1_9ASPA|nr:Retrovirus-related Pol polyprotein from transposon TNT 1-94 [Dendrobium catenatum]
MDNQNNVMCTSLHNKKCNTCNLAKSNQLPLNLSVSTTVSIFELIHSDVWGPSSCVSIQGYRYYISFIDDFSRFCWVFPLHQKSDVIHKFIELYHWVRCQFNKSIKTIRTNGDGEYINHNFQQVCKTWGITHQYSCPYTPAQNGVAEHKNRHIIETIRSLLIQSQAPHELWTHGLLTSVYLINIIPSSKTQNKTPYQGLYNKLSSYDHLKIFGCLCYPWLRPYTKSKLSPLSTPCVFLGYVGSQIGYYCFDPNTHKTFTSRHVVLNESEFPYLLYRQLVGALQYLTLTRPNISYAVNKVSQHMHYPLESHFDALKRILRFLKGTSDYGLPLSGKSLKLQSYVDSDWVGDRLDRRSMTGYLNLLGNSPISWSLKKKTTVARLSLEVEYRALALAAIKIIWLRQLLQELDCSQRSSTPLHCDNTSAIALANNPIYHARTKHIEIDCHFIRNCIKEQTIQVHHIANKDQLADLFTKSLPRAQLRLISTKLISSNDSSV